MLVCCSIIIIATGSHTHHQCHSQPAALGVPRARQQPQLINGFKSLKISKSAKPSLTNPVQRLQPFVVTHRLAGVGFPTHVWCHSWAFLFAQVLGVCHELSRKMTDTPGLRRTGNREYRGTPRCFYFSVGRESGDNFSTTPVVWQTLRSFLAGPLGTSSGLASSISLILFVLAQRHRILDALLGPSTRRVGARCPRQP